MGKTRLKDLTGLVFGRLTAIKRIEQTGTTKNARWLCQCSCGNTHEANSSALLRGAIKSCKCLAKELTIKLFTTHGGSRSPEWNTWQGMRQRCANPKSEKFQLYGARGIVVCARWRASFEEFLKDMGKKPTPGHSLDRIDVNGGYGPENCRWATPKVQANNLRATRYVTVNKETKPLSYWIEDSGIASQTVHNRIARGTPQSEWFNKPHHQHVINGESKSISEWANISGVKPDTVFMRIRRGWAEDRWFIPLVRQSPIKRFP